MEHPWIEENFDYFESLDVHLQMYPWDEDTSEVFRSWWDSIKELALDDDRPMPYLGGKRVADFLQTFFVFHPVLRLLDSPGKLIDIGCGNGRPLRFLHENAKHEVVPYGLDFDERRLRDAREYILPDFKDNLKLGNYEPGERLPWDFGFDYVMMSVGLFEQEMKPPFRLLNPEGKLILYTYLDTTDVDEGGRRVTWKTEQQLPGLGFKKIENKFRPCPLYWKQREQ